MTKIILFIAVFFCWLLGAQEDDSSPYELFEDQWVVHSTVGLNTAPFSISDKVGQQRKIVRYRPNMNPTIGFGVSYKYLALSMSFKTPGYLRNEDIYGQTNYIDLDMSFQLKNWLFLGDFHWYEGFSYRIMGEDNIYNQPQLRTHSTRINSYYFTNPAYVLQAAKGITGRYLKNTFSYFLKGTAALHGVAQTGSSILPLHVFGNDKNIWQARRLSAFDIGIVPGAAFVSKTNDWQFGLIAGTGAVIQTKFYRSPGISRGFMGLAPRIDLQAQVGYNPEKWFVFLHVLFDNKSIAFNDYKYRQVYYFLRLTAGYRIPEQKTKKINFDFLDW